MRLVWPCPRNPLQVLSNCLVSMPSAKNGATNAHINVYKNSIGWPHQISHPSNLYLVSTPACFLCLYGHSFVSLCSGLCFKSRCPPLNFQIPSRCTRPHLHTFAVFIRSFIFHHQFVQRKSLHSWINSVSHPNGIRSIVMSLRDPLHIDACVSVTA